MAKINEVRKQTWTLGERLMLGATVSSVVSLIFVIYLAPLMALLGAALGWWFGVGVVRGLWQGALFGLAACATGWLLTFVRVAIYPERASTLGRRR